MTALGQKWTFAFYFLFDQLISALLQKWGHVEAEQLGCLEIEDELNFHRLLNGKIGRLSSQPKPRDSDALYKCSL